MIHAQVWRYLELEKKLDSPDFFSRIQLAAELCIQPLIHILFWMCFFLWPNALKPFGYVTLTKFRVTMYVISSIQMCVHAWNGWRNMIEFYHLGTLFLVTHIKYAKHPFAYTINSSHPSHQLFKYAAFTALTPPTGSLRTSPGTS